MRLKRVRATEATLEEKGDGMISRVDPGLCFDFPAHDTSIYYAGTEVWPAVSIDTICHRYHDTLL
jgi:hypothetical protein